MKLRDIIFTDVVLGAITFSQTPLQPGTPVKIQAIYKTIVTLIYVKEAQDPDHVIYDALTKFNWKNPLEIPYQNPTASASDPEVIQAINSEMKSRDPIFTDQVTAKISFNNRPLQPNIPTLVVATYKKLEIGIHVKEAKNPDIYQELTKFNKTNPIEILYNKANPHISVSDSKVTQAIKSEMNLKNPGVFKPYILAEISFANKSLRPGIAVPIQATYKTKKTSYYLRQRTR